MTTLLSENSLVRCERNSYQLVRKLSSGGMGVVWEAKPKTAHRRLVIKEPLINHDNDRIKTERLLIEANILRTINDELGRYESNNVNGLIQRHVVKYVDELSDVDHPILVLEFIDGPVLSALCRGRPLEFSEAIRNAVAILRATEALHSKGVLHRDISPSNIIVDLQRGPVLIDLGTSTLRRRGQARSDDRRVVFKRGFSAPELRDRQADERSDIFSLGATLFYTLTGKNPGDFMTDSRHVLTKSPSQVSELIPRWVSEIIEIAMSSDPNERFQSAGAMLAALTEGDVTASHPTISLGGTEYVLNARVVDIGREHRCDHTCSISGLRGILQIRLRDTQKYVEKHHVRIWVQPSGHCSIEDLNTTNRTAIKNLNDSDFKILAPRIKESLHQGDTVALAFSPTRGPYVTFRFQSSGTGVRQK